MGVYWLVRRQAVFIEAEQSQWPVALAENCVKSYEPLYQVVQVTVDQADGLVSLLDRFIIALCIFYYEIWLYDDGKQYVIDPEECEKEEEGEYKGRA